jgi:DNA replication and repair protein RecF
LRLKRIRLLQFRNYSDWECEFPESGAVLYGSNGCGKTNLLEAIAYCSTGKSVKLHNDSMLIQFNKKSFQIDASFVNSFGDIEITAVSEYSNKKFTLNQSLVKQLSKIYEYIKVVYCSPDDTLLINGNPRSRRRYFDHAIAQVNPNYITLLKNYNHIVEQRNLLLKDSSNLIQKKYWDDLFVNASIPIMTERFRYCDKLKDTINRYYSPIVAEANGLSIDYNATLCNQNKDIVPEKILERIHKLESKELLYQRSLLGPHLDDYLLMIDGRAVTNVSSQGQKRTISLIIKIAQLELIKDMISDYPVLLLDDIFAELDQKHIYQFMQLLNRHEQVFIATPNKTTAELWKDLHVMNLG